MKAQVCRFMPMLVALVVFASGAVAEDDEKNGSRAADDEKRGLPVQDGDKLEGEVKGKRTQSTTTFARESQFCELLLAAAKNPGKPFINGKTQFIGHEPWVARLICNYIDQSAAETNPAFTDYDKRESFLKEVLDAFQDHAGMETQFIAIDRLVVGKQPRSISIFVQNGDVKRASSPEKRKFYVARSFETPELFLLAATKSAFLPTTRPANLLQWIQVAEKFILRIHSLVTTGTILFAQRLDEPYAKLGERVQAETQKFKNEHKLLNSGDYNFREDVDLSQEAPPNDGPELPPPPTPSERSIELKLDGPNGSEESGLNLFVYAPMRRPPGDEWFIAALRGASPVIDAAGFTFPMSDIRVAPPQSGVLHDRIFDEESESDHEMRFEIDVACVVRTHYYEAGENTATVREHELKHAAGISEAWSGALEIMSNDLADLTSRINRELGLADDDRFVLEENSVALLWTPKQGKELVSSIPEGFVTPGQQSFLKLRRPVLFRRFRLVRRSSKEDKFSQAKAIWKEWTRSDRIRDSYRDVFVRAYLLNGLELDAREGVMSANGTLGNDSRITRKKIEEFRKATQDLEKVDPHEEFDKLFQ